MTLSGYEAIMLLVLFVTLVFLTYISPMVGDDFEFKSLSSQLNTFSSVFNYCLYYGNGRIAGNVGVIYLLKSKIVAALVKSSIIVAIIYLIPRVLNVYNQYRYVFLIFLLIGINPVIFAQVYSWTSGFQNYVPPILISLICIYAIQNLDNNVFFSIAFFCLAFFGQFFVEHTSLVNILISILLIYHYKNDLIKRRYSNIYLAACFLGFIVMMLIPKIFYIADNRTEGYRVLHLLNINCQ